MASDVVLDNKRWYKEDIGPRLRPIIREVYRKWAGIADDDELIQHLHKIRDKAWPFGEYPCVGEWIFLLPSISSFPEFPVICDLLKRKSSSAAHPVVLDLGCCFGQDLRLLASQGISTTGMWATDRTSELWQLGFELFRDHGKLQAQFVEADFLSGTPSSVREANPEATGILSPETVHELDLGSLAQLTGAVDVVVSNQFLHLFSLPVQTYACVKIVKMTHVGSVLIGYQQSRARARAYDTLWGPMFYHSEVTWRTMWQEVAKLTGTEWEIQAREVSLGEWGMEEEDYEWMPADRQGINFVCTRIK